MLDLTTHCDSTRTISRDAQTFACSGQVVRSARTLLLDGPNYALALECLGSRRTVYYRNEEDEVRLNGGNSRVFAYRSS